MLMIAELVARANFVPKEPLRGAQPLSLDALVERVTALLQNDPALFLERYGDFLLQVCLQLGIRIQRGFRCSVASDAAWHPPERAIPERGSDERGLRQSVASSSMWPLSPLP